MLEAFQKVSSVCITCRKRQGFRPFTVAINAKLHEEVKQFVDSDESNYSGYKDFYEQAAREKLEDERSSDFDLTMEEIKMLKNLAKKELEK
jgi:hypothetical protein